MKNKTMEEIYKVLEICVPGENSVIGAIFKQLGTDTDSEMNKYTWIIFTDINAFGMIEQECVNLKLHGYIIADRKTLVVPPR